MQREALEHLPAFHLYILHVSTRTSLPYVNSKRDGGSRLLIKAVADVEKHAISLILEFTTTQIFQRLVLREDGTICYPWKGHVIMHKNRECEGAL